MLADLHRVPVVQRYGLIPTHSLTSHTGGTLPVYHQKLVGWSAVIDHAMKSGYPFSRKDDVILRVAANVGDSLIRR